MEMTRRPRAPRTVAAAHAIPAHPRRPGKRLSGPGHKCEDVRGSTPLLDGVWRPLALDQKQSAGLFDGGVLKKPYTFFPALRMSRWKNDTGSPLPVSQACELAGAARRTLAGQAWFRTNKTTTTNEQIDNTL